MTNILSISKKGLGVSIPQAVSAVATGYKTFKQFERIGVSIPQAVSAVATTGIIAGKLAETFQYRKR